LKNIKGLTSADIPEYSNNNHWMNLLQIDYEEYGCDRETLMKRLEKNGIQTRPVWGLNHLQKPFLNFKSYKIKVANDLVNNSLCIPSSVNITAKEFDKIINSLIKY